MIEALDELKIKFPPELATLLDLSTPLSSPEPQQVAVTELHKLYKEAGVEPHRFALAELNKLMLDPALTESFLTPNFAGLLPELGIDWSTVVPNLFPTDGNTRYEELDCVGYDARTDTLVGVIRVKLSSGYSGGLCTPGSHEYVTFWADLDNNGIFETCLGTASVRVHDTPNVPSQGLEYAVYMPAGLARFRQPCDQGPKVVKIRAILEWQRVPPCGNPNHIPIWGNREETLIHIAPGPVIIPGDFRPYLDAISPFDVCSIDQITGLTSGERPYGGDIYITGSIPGALLLNVPDTLKYRVTVEPLDTPGGPQALNDSFAVEVRQFTGGGTAISPLTQFADLQNRFIYRRYGSTVANMREVISPEANLLAIWHTHAPMTGRWRIRVEAWDTTTTPDTHYSAGETTCTVDGSTRQDVIVLLDEQAPTVSVSITGFSTGGGPIQPVVDCATLTKGVTIHGQYSVTAEQHFSSLSLTVEPADAAHGATINPSSRAYPVVPTTGETGTWTLDTSAMDPCGYVVRLVSTDRTIVSRDGGWLAEDFVGFCLKAP